MSTVKFTHEYRTEDKHEWGDGQWQSEPDKAQWKDEATGFPCLIVRNGSGALCGYVGVPEGHPFYEKGYDDCNVRAHGGLTFAGHCHKGQAVSYGICHIAEPGEPDHVWWLGFDCAHSGDMIPGFSMGGLRDSGVYRDIDYVIGQCQELALQLKEACIPKPS